MFVTDMKLAITDNNLLDWKDSDLGLEYKQVTIVRRRNVLGFAPMKSPSGFWERAYLLELKIWAEEICTCSVIRDFLRC